MNSMRLQLPASQIYDSRYSPVMMRADPFGDYIREIKKQAKMEIKTAKENRKKEEKTRRKELYTYQGYFFRTLSHFWNNVIWKLGEDWIFLAFLGVIMALISYGIDKLILAFTSARTYLYRDIAYNNAGRYFGWISVPVVLILFNTGWVFLVGPQSAGSGLPEMKTILRGVILKEYLTLRVLIAKIIGISCTIGSGMPLGKEGPLVHMSSIVTTLYGKLVEKIRGFDDSELRKTDMLAAACAVGVATTFAAPVGGVLFSIEVTTAYFAVRNYFRGFFAAVCGALTYRLLSVWIDGVNTVTPVFKTNFFVDLPFNPQELVAFAIIGIICGVGGAVYVWSHRQYVLFTKRNIVLKWINQKCRFIYPLFVVLVISSVTFPIGIGQYLAGHIPPKIQVTNLFSNFTWMNTNLTIAQEAVLSNWRTSRTGPYLHLCCFMAYMYLGSILSSTMPVPNGTFIPVFRIGAAFGRIVGELMHSWWPRGMLHGGKMVKVIPGGYATVGAAAFTGSVTQTISVAVIVFEMTGQITHILPIMVAVLIANAISSKLGPSCYNSVIMVKKLPYLPDLLSSCSGMYEVCVEDFMIKDIKFLYYGMTYRELCNILKEHKNLRSFPLVENAENMILLGSIKRRELAWLMDHQIGRQRRLEYMLSRRGSISMPELNVENNYDEIIDDIRRISVYDNVDEVTELADEELEDEELKVDEDLSGEKEVPKDNKIKEAFRKIFRLPTSQQYEKDENHYEEIPTTPAKFKLKFFPKWKTSSLPKEPTLDMTPTEQEIWKNKRLDQQVDFSLVPIDPAPFQLVDKTSLLKVHSLFSMVGVNIAYVTAIGRLIGVVSLKEVRKAIEDVNSGTLKPQTLRNLIEAANNVQNSQNQYIITKDVKNQSGPIDKV